MHKLRVPPPLKKLLYKQLLLIFFFRDITSSVLLIVKIHPGMVQNLSLAIRICKIGSWVQNDAEVCLSCVLLGQYQEVLTLSWPFQLFKHRDPVDLLWTLRIHVHCTMYNLYMHVCTAEQRRTQAIFPANANNSRVVSKSKDAGNRKDARIAEMSAVAGTPYVCCAVTVLVG
jgi:hypothetical protein